MQLYNAVTSDTITASPLGGAEAGLEARSLVDEFGQLRATARKCLISQSFEDTQNHDLPLVTHF